MGMQMHVLRFRQGGGDSKLESWKCGANRIPRLLMTYYCIIVNWYKKLY